jgi:hypothetical protein
MPSDQQESIRFLLPATSAILGLSDVGMAVPAAIVLDRGR